MVIMYINGKIQTSTALMRHEHVYLHYKIMPLFRNGKCGSASIVLMLQINSAYIFLQTSSSMPLQDKGPQNVGNAAL